MVFDVDSHGAEPCRVRTISKGEAAILFERMIDVRKNPALPSNSWLPLRWCQIVNGAFGYDRHKPMRSVVNGSFDVEASAINERRIE